MGLDPTLARRLLLLVTGWGGAFLAALWVSLVFWAYRDMRSRGRDPLAPILAALLVAVLSLPGLLVYLILRPARTLDEEYQRTLEEEALLQAVEETTRCPGCGRRVKEDWILCPHCHTRLKKACHHCGKLMDLSWNICPYCGTPAPGMHKEGQTLDDALRTAATPAPEAEEVAAAEEPPPPAEAAPAEAEG